MKSEKRKLLAARFLSINIIVDLSKLWPLLVEVVICRRQQGAVKNGARWHVKKKKLMKFFWMYIINKKPHDFSRGICDESALVNFQRPQIALALPASAILLVFKKITCADLSQIALEIIQFPLLICSARESNIVSLRAGGILQILQSDWVRERAIFYDLAC